MTRLTGFFVFYPLPNYNTSGAGKIQHPFSNSAILAWAGYELSWEMMIGFWESRAA